MTEVTMTSPQNKRALPHLEQLDGFRFLVAFWLIIAHNFDPAVSPVGGLYERFCMRRYVAVSFFIVLSGFVSHYAYGNRDLSSRETLRKFYIGRVGSILACYFVTMILATALRIAAGHYSTSYCIQGLILSLFLLQTWIPRYAYFGNTPAWTMSTLVAHWAAYPFLQPRLKLLSDRRLVISTIVLPFVALIPPVVFLWAGSSDDLSATRRQWYALYTHPVFRFADFAYGSLLAELFVRDSVRPALLVKLSDICMPVVFVLILAVPYTKRLRPYDTILIEAPMHLFGLLIYGSSCKPRGSLLGYLMALETFRKLGDFAFQVYLFRWPLFAAVHWWEVGELKKGWMALSLPYLIPSMIVLYILSYLWFTYVDNPIRLYLARITKPTEDMAMDLLRVEIDQDQKSTRDEAVADSNLSHNAAAEFA